MEGDPVLLPAGMDDASVIEAGRRAGAGATAARPCAWRAGGIACVWLLLVAAGLGAVWRYALAPGQEGAAPARWPPGSVIQPEPGRATLVMFVHPRCPCSRASLGELALALTRARDRASAYVVFNQPEGLPDEWVKTDLWSSAAAIPGVTVVRDPAGDEARRFGAFTSGQTLLYDEEGRLLFGGGITDARGHSGDNEGRDAVVSLLRSGAAPRRSTAVFGCALFDAAAACAAGEGACAP